MLLDVNAGESAQSKPSSVRRASITPAPGVREFCCEGPPSQNMNNCRHLVRVAGTVQSPVVTQKKQRFPRSYNRLLRMSWMRLLSYNHRHLNWSFEQRALAFLRNCARGCKLFDMTTYTACESSHANMDARVRRFDVSSRASISSCGTRLKAGFWGAW